MWQVFHGDALELLRTVPSASIHSIVTDPPAGIFFMGRHWDSDKGGAAQWVAWLTEIMRECRRVLKPGGHMLVWALPRTSHRTGTAIEAAGFEVVDVVTHHFGSGMPKSKDASKAIDHRLGTTEQRQVYATYTAGGNAGTSTADKGGTYGVGVANSAPIELTRTLGGSFEARQWDGWGTGLKPSSEHWILARKPRDGTLADNLLHHGTGAINVDGCRVGTDWNEPDRPVSWAASAHSAKPEAEKIAAPPGVGMVLHPGGRWPPNAVFTHSAGCRRVGERKIRGGNDPRGADGRIYQGGQFLNEGGLKHGYQSSHKGFADADGTETVPVYECAVDCPVRLLEAQSGILTSGAWTGQLTHGMGSKNNTLYGNRDKRPMWRDKDVGTAARFFPRFEWSGELDDPFVYAGKASTKEREAGCEAIPVAENKRHNDHNTVKSVALMRYLTRLVTPPGGVCLDIFCGSGTTGVACVHEGFHFMGFELDYRFACIAHARIAHWQGRIAA